MGERKASFFCVLDAPSDPLLHLPQDRGRPEIFDEGVDDGELAQPPDQRPMPPG